MTNNFRRFFIAATSLSVLSLAACGSATDSSSKQTSVVTSTAETTLSEKATTSEVTETEAKAEKTTVAEIKDSSSSDGGAADIAQDTRAHREGRRRGAPQDSRPGGGNGHAEGGRHAQGPRRDNQPRGGVRGDGRRLIPKGGGVQWRQETRSREEP